MEISELYQVYLQHPSVQTDTRKLRSGDLFFALTGDRFNGNTFAAKALEMGAAYVVIDDAEFQIDERTILVKNVLETLQQLALYHRKQLSIPVLAITGSNGKTTTKELIHEVLSKKYRTYTTVGNLNNHIGIPLTLLRIQADAEMAVVEMGANHQKEIASYCAYTQPTHGLITNLGKAHLEGFGGVEGVRKGKGELFDYLRSKEGTAFVFWDDEHLRRQSQGIETVVRYGTREGDIVGEAIATEGAQQEWLHVKICKGADIGCIATQLVGSYNAPNVIAAVAVGKCFGVVDEDIKSAIEAYRPENSRSQLIVQPGRHIILDAYNANPSSMRLAIENFIGLDLPAKILMLGAMAELGEGSIAEHQAILDLIATSQWKAVILVGGDFAKLQHPYEQFNNSEEARNWLARQDFNEPVSLLIKGSRSTQMEKVLA